MNSSRIALNENGRRIGEGHQRATISDADVKRMRDLHEFGEPPDFEKLGCKRIGKLMGYHYRTVARICAYERRNQTARGWKPGPSDEQVGREQD